MMETRWWWLRHAPVAGGSHILAPADAKADLSDISALSRLASALPRKARIITSPLTRARESGAALAGIIGQQGGAWAPSLIEADFSEQDFGTWEGKSHEALGRENPAQSKAFWADPVNHAPPGGESFAAVCTRTARAIERLSQSGKGGDIIIVAHAGAIRAALSLALGGAPDRALSFALAPLSLTRLTAQSEAEGVASWRIETVNQLF